MTKETLLSGLEQSTQTLIELLLRFTPEAFIERPSETEWSAALIAGHLVKVYFSTSKAMSGETIPTNRPPDQKLALLKAAMEDDTTKRISPERVQPASEAVDRSTLVQQIRQLAERLKEILRTSDITDACVSFKHPVLGTLTKMEWLAFNNYHTERHIRQLERLLQKVSV